MGTPSVPRKSYAQQLEASRERKRLKRRERGVKERIPIIFESGERLGRLTVIGKHDVRSKDGHILWSCHCDCGNMVLVIASDLRRGNTRSCGCLHRDIITLEPGRAAFNSLYYDYNKNATERGYSFELTPEEAEIFFQGNCSYCGVVPSQVKRHKSFTSEYIYNGIDRVDNSLGYTLDNCVSCCEQCNRGKRDLSVSEFLDWIRNVYEHSFGV